MSYCRFSEGDLYLLATGEGWECYACRLLPTDEWYGSWIGLSLLDVKAHLEEHLDAEHIVPERAIKRIEEELAEEKEGE